MFTNYASAFESLNAANIVPFFYSHSILMTDELFALMNSQDEIQAVFSELFRSLKKKEFKESILESLQINYLSKNQSSVEGIARRININGETIEHFGFTYTLRKDIKKWKIISGIVHDLNLFKACFNLEKI